MPTTLRYDSIYCDFIYTSVPAQKGHTALTWAESLPDAKEIIVITKKVSLNEDKRGLA